MAIVNCPECNQEVSDKASTCPSCGYPLQQSLVKNSPNQALTQASKTRQEESTVLKQSVADPINDFQQRKSSGGAKGAVIGAVAGYFLMASSCGMPEGTGEFTMTLFMWSPVIGLGMFFGYFVGKAIA